jgi:hypothetical protein
MKAIVKADWVSFWDDVLLQRLVKHGMLDDVKIVQRQTKYPSWGCDVLSLNPTEDGSYELKLFVDGNVLIGIQENEEDADTE